MWTTPAVSELPRRRLGLVPRVGLAGLMLTLICATGTTTERRAPATISLAKAPGATAAPWQVDVTPMSHGDYDVGIAERGNGARTLFVERDRKVIYQWKGSIETPLEVVDDVLYYCSHSPIASGATIVAVDLTTGTELWRNNLRGLGPIGHSQYRNRVWLQVGSDVIAVQGEESAGNYVELVDRKTGTTRANVR